MAAAYRVIVSSVSCYNSVVVDRRTHSHAVHYCSGPCGALSQGLDCTVAHRGTCSELLVAPDPAPYVDPNNSPLHSCTVVAHQLPNHVKTSLTMDIGYNGGLERASSSGNLSLGEDSPPWRSKKPPGVVSSTGTLSSSGSLKDITEEAINLASGKIKEFSFDKLRLSSSSHVTLRKGRKVRPDSFSRRSTDLDIIYGHFSASGSTNGTTNGGGTSDSVAANDENLPPFLPAKGGGLEEMKLKSTTGSLSSATKVGGGSTSSLSSIGSLDQSLNTVASLYLNTLGEENLITRLLEKTKAEAGAGGTGGEDIRACLDILLKCSEDLKKCTDIIKQCIRRKAGGGQEEGGASPDSVYRAVMSRLNSYLKKLPLELEGLGSFGGSGGPGCGPNDLAELVNTLHSFQQGPYSPIFGNEQPPRYEDVVQSPPLPKAASHSSTPAILSPSSSLKPDSSIANPILTSPSRLSPLPNGLQHLHASTITQHTLSPPSITCSPSRSSPTHSPSPLHASPTPPYTQTPPASPMEALYIEEEEADMDKPLEQVLPQTHTPTKGVKTTHNQNGTLGQHLSHLHPHHSATNSLPSSISPAWPSTISQKVPAARAVSHRNDDIDKLLMDLENLSQSMSHPRKSEPPLPAKTRKRDGSQQAGTGEALAQPKVAPFPARKHDTYPSMNGSASRGFPQSLTPPPRENSEAVVGEEEDGALLLRILESIESFAQELVDSGAGSTGSAERSSGKEREVMKLLQGTLATTSRAGTPVESPQPLQCHSAPSIDITTVPAIPPKQSSAVLTSLALVAAPEAPLGVYSEPVEDTAASTEPSYTAEVTTETTEEPAESSTAESDPESSLVPEGAQPSTLSDEDGPVAEPEAAAPLPAIPTAVASRDAAVESAAAAADAAARDAGSTLLIQQSPEVIRVSEIYMFVWFWGWS